MSEVINSWFFDTIGIVKVYDETTKTNKFYIGQTLGFDQKEDETHIKNWGMPFIPESIK